MDEEYNHVSNEDVSRKMETKGRFKISWTEQVNNDEVFRKMETKWSLLLKIKERQLKVLKGFDTYKRITA